MIRKRWHRGDKMVAFLSIICGILLLIAPHLVVIFVAAYLIISGFLILLD